MKPPLTYDIAAAIETHLAAIVTRSELDDLFRGTPLASEDPGSYGKGPRLRAVLAWAVAHDVEAGKDFVDQLFSRIRGQGRLDAIGEDGLCALKAVFRKEGCELTNEGEFSPLFLDGLSERELPAALRQYVQRAKAGHMDAALVTGTGKDRLEAVAAHVCGETPDADRKRLSFPKRLRSAFSHLGMAFGAPAADPATAHVHDLERSMYTLACRINDLRNNEGTGHGRPWLPNVSPAESKAAIEFMGVIAEYMLTRHDELNS